MRENEMTKNNAFVCHCHSKDNFYVSSSVFLCSSFSVCFVLFVEFTDLMKSMLFACMTREFSGTVCSVIS